MMNKQSLSNTYSWLIASILLLQAAVADARYICYYNGCFADYGWVCSRGVCWSNYYRGYVCCDTWYGSAWAVVLWVFLSLVLIACCVWCCIAASATPPAGVVYAEPAQVITVKTQTKPASTTGTAGKSQVYQAGTYSTAPVAGQPVAQGAPVSHQMQTELSAAPVAPAPVVGAPVASPVYQGTVASSSAGYPNLQAPAGAYTGGHPNVSSV